MAEGTDWDDMVLVGFIARRHGNRGEVILNSETDFPDERFKPGATLFARPSSTALVELKVTTARFQQGRPILGLEGVTTMNEAERLAGTELRVPSAWQKPLAPGMFYHHELIGCEVRTTDGISVGTVAAVEGETGAVRLVVRGPRAEVLIPLADALCRVEVSAKRVTVNAVEGLLDLNGDWRSLP